MTLYFPLLSDPLRFEENRAQVLIIENAAALRDCLRELEAQIKGEPGSFVLAVQYEPCELSRLALLVTDPLHPDLDSRKLLGKLQQELILAAEDYREDFRKIYAQINDLAAKLSLSLDLETDYSELERPDEIIRLLNFRPDREGLSFAESLLEWIRMYRRFFGKRLFIFYGLKSLLSLEELRLFYQIVFYEKLDLLLIESGQRGVPLPEECVTIIDEDLCVISQNMI